MSALSTFFFYDLETSGLDPRRHRIMQFAGQRTDMQMKPIGDPIDILVALTDEILPDPGAIFVTGITPQKTIEEGYTEAEFLRILHEKVFLPGTIMVGFNNVRFDDEFMRHTLFRNFYDPYEWSWKQDRSRWDLLDVVRMTRALRPEGMQWPFDEKGEPMNRLEKLSAVNSLEHEHAHDALSDVMALIGVAKLIQTKQPKLFTYLLSMRSKKEVASLVNLDAPGPFVHTAGQYPKATLHTTAAYPLAPGSKPGSVLVYDLRHDPRQWQELSIEDMKKLRFAKREQRLAPNFTPLPVRELAYNQTPAVAPLGVLDGAAQERLGISLDAISRHLQSLQKSDLTDRFAEVFRNGGGYPKTEDVDASLYDGFITEADEAAMSAVRAADASSLAGFHPPFIDERLEALLLRYKARNYPQSLQEDERVAWEEYRAKRLQRDYPIYNEQLARYAKTADDEKTFLLEELRLWAESVLPA